jgi:protein disulfide-isomerase A6
LLLTTLVSAEGMYSKNSPVLQINGMEYDRLIAKSNYTSVSSIQ